MADIDNPSGFTVPTQGLVKLTHVMYGMHAFSALMGILGPAFIITAFLTGWPSIIAIIINYVQRDEVRQTFLDSHFRWQLRTFWFAVLWAMVMALLIMSFFGIPLAAFVGFGVGLWVLYRIIRGWIALANSKPMPM